MATLKHVHITETLTVSLLFQNNLFQIPLRVFKVLQENVILCGKYIYFFYYKNKNVIHQSINVNKFSSLLGAPNIHTKGYSHQSKLILKDSLSNLTVFLYFLKKVLHL